MNLASRFVDVEKLPWEKTAYAGIEQKTLLFDRDTGLVTALMRMAPGARLPDHEHAGSRHEAWAGPQGGLFLAMFQVPNRFFQRDGRVTDFLGNDWEKTWGKASRS